MKKLATLVFGLAASSFAQGASLLPPVVKELDLSSYLGRWYEVASTKPFFQKDCVCVTADYQLQDDASVKVVNSCRKKSPDGELDQTTGSAQASKNPGKFKVSFGGFQFPFTNYWVVDLADDYRYAVVSTPFRTPIWILSRTPEMDAADLDGIYERLEAQGFKTSKISSTLQNECPETALPE